MNKKLNYFLLLLITCNSPTYSADSASSYAIKGVGIASCSHFIKSAKAQDKLYFIYGGWVDGFVTASNQHLRETFDLTPWQSTGLLLKIAESICAQNPKMQFHQAINKIKVELAKQRLDKGENYVDIANNKKYVYQEEVIRRMKQMLKNKKHYSGPINAEYDENMKIAVKSFQKSIKQSQTGLPDQGTLFELFKP